MKYSNYLKIIGLVSMFIISAKGMPLPSNPNVKQSSTPKVSYKLLIPRMLIPMSLKGRIQKVRESYKKEINVSVDCNDMALCATFDTNTSPKSVSSWMGFEYQYKTEKYFIATYGQEATYLANNTYVTTKWAKQHFWINIGKKVVPFPIQPRFVGIDEESKNEWYIVDYLGYRKANINYSNYKDNMSTSSLVLLINPTTKKVEQYHLEYYDENDEYAGEYAIEIGDEIESYFLGFKKGEDNTDYLFSLEDITKVTHPITFSYKEQYPGKDFNCTYCEDLNLAEVEFKYIFEAYGEKRSNFTEPQPIEQKETNTSDSNNITSSSSKSVSISGTWILFLLTIFISFLTFKKEKLK